VEELGERSIERFIPVGVPDWCQAIEGGFQEWYRANTGLMWEAAPGKSDDVIEASNLDYVILRNTWLYGREGNTRLHVTEKGEPFVEAQVTRQAVSQFITDLLTNRVDYHRANLGLGEPGTEYTKPSFY